MVKNIVCVTAHAVTEDSVNILNRCVNSLKSLGYRVVLTSYADVDSSIVKLVDYCIKINDNPLIRFDEYDKIGGGIYYWEDFPQYYLLKKVDYNHGFAHLRLMVTAAQIAKLNGCTNIHFVNYDFIVKHESVLQTSSRFLDHTDAYFYSWNEPDNIITGFFSFRTDKFLEVFSSIDTKDKYCEHGSIFETLFLDVCKKNSVKYYIKDREKVSDLVDMDLLYNPEAYSLFVKGDIEIRMTPCLGKDGRYYIFASSNRTVERNFLNINHGGRYYSVDINVRGFTEIPEKMFSDGFEATLGSIGKTVRFDSRSNFSHCEIKDWSVVKQKIEL